MNNKNFTSTAAVFPALETRRKVSLHAGCVDVAEPRRSPGALDYSREKAEIGQKSGPLTLKKIEAGSDACT